MTTTAMKTPRAEPDRGTDGPAMAARPWTMATVEADTDAEDGTARFTRSDVKRVQDGVIDAYASRGALSGFSLDAAGTLARLYHDGRVAPSGWRQMGSYGGGEMSDARADAWRDYCAALDQIPVRCQETCADLAAGRFPARLNALAEMRDGFAALAKHWRLGPRHGA